MLAVGGKARLSLLGLQREIAACRICAESLPLGPRPVVQFAATSRIAIVGQAPGTRVHASGVPWEDDSGDHLREWLGVDRAQFYDPSVFALVPMGFCYPGKAAGGDAPPRPECAPQWHEPVLRSLVGQPLLLLAGQYAQRYYLGRERKATLTATVQAFEDYLPRFLPVPHPSWRSKLWMAKNAWFAERLLPRLRALVQEALAA